MKNNPQEERELIDACVAGNKNAWDQFVERYSKLIYSTLHHVLAETRFTDKKDIIDELFNETFVALIKDNAKKLQQFQGRCSLASWIRLITVNGAIDYLRRLKPVTTSLDEESEEGPSLADVIADEKAQDIRETLTGEDEKEIFFNAFKELDVKDQLLLRLLFIDEASPEEAAEIMGLTKEAIYMRKSRLVNELKKLISHKISVRKVGKDRQL